MWKLRFTYEDLLGMKEHSPYNFSEFIEKYFNKNRTLGDSRD
jgi:predicted CopG family antitoxin